MMSVLVFLVLSFWEVYTKWKFSLLTFLKHTNNQKYACLDVAPKLNEKYKKILKVNKIIGF